MEKKMLCIVVCTLLITTALSATATGGGNNSVVFSFSSSTTSSVFDEDSVYEVYEGQHIEIEVTARWDPPDPERPICLWVDHETLPEGATVNPDPATGYGQTSCVLSWTPAVGQAGTYNITFYVGEECGVPIGYHTITIIVHPAPTPGLTFSQVDFDFKEVSVPDSSWGRLEVDVDVFTESQGLDEGYLNGYSDAGWVIQNLLIQPLEGLDTITTYFDLSVPEGTDISTLSLYLEFTEEPVLEFHDGPRTEYPVDTAYYNAEGVGKTSGEDECGGGCMATPPEPQWFDPFGETWHFKKPQGPNENVECACCQCFPMSIANSLQYLENKYGINVPHQHKPGLKGDNTLVGQLDSACDRRVKKDAAGKYCRWDGKGVWFDDMLEGKFKYLKNNGLADKLTHKHQGYGYGWVDANNNWKCEKGELRYNQGVGSLPAGDFKRHGITSKDESVGGKVTFDWLCEQIKKCEDVEIVFACEDNDGNITGGHAVRVFGCGKIFGVPFLLYKHDRIQTYKRYGMVWGDTVGLEEVFVFVKDLDGDGMMNLGSRDKEICFALSESPRLPTWKYHFSYSDCPGGWLRVYATHNCARIGLLFDGYVRSCQTYEGFVPEKIGDLTVNDVIYDFYWDYYCNNVDHIKLVYPNYNYDLGKWELLPITEVFNHYIPEDLIIPFIGDPTGEIQEIYVVIDLSEFLENPQPPQESYVITDGRCDDLPGYLIGTTPIEFDPTAPADEDPFTTTPFNGVLWEDSEITTEPEEELPCYPTVEIVSGFQFGKIAATVANEECPDLSNLEWSITVEGGFVLAGAESSGVINSLPAGEQTTIQSNFILGFGPATVTVTVDGCEPVTTNVFLLGPFVFVY
ncbi:MAG TPA: hypothetical protein ENI42_00145 [Thermoplasmatales archaeon]|nr:hypothetical protein [Thermoplasmatales archaeon]